MQIYFAIQSRHGSFPIKVLIIAISLMFVQPIAAQIDATDSDSDVHIIAAPYFLANSDDGLTIGFGFGAAYAPRLYTISSFEYSLSGQMNMYAEGEVKLGEYRYVGRISFNRSERSIYPSLPVDPEPLVNADVERIDIKMAALRSYGSVFEFGPAIWVETAKGMRPEDADKNPLDLNMYPRFRPGTIALGGTRARWRTTSSVRPMNGYIFDVTTLGGAAWSDEWDAARPDLSVQFKGALAQPVKDWMRLYLRAEIGLQLNTPPPLRYYNGGSKKVRGQPKRRETGRRAIYTRAQTHFTVVRDWTWPTEVAHSVLSFIPVYGLEVELVPFYDMGVIADPDFGWLPARHGFGMGLHLVLPPELVVRIDVGMSPGGSPRFYFTIGEAI